MENLKKKREKDWQSLPDLIFVRFDNETGNCIPADQMGFIYERDEVGNLFKGFSDFFKSTSDEEIREHNKALLKEYNKSYSAPVKEKEPIIAYVYLMQDDDNNNVKIGVSKDPKARLSQLQSGNPGLRLIYYKKVKDAYSVEEQLHKDYSDKGLGREWFKLKPSDIANIKKHLIHLQKIGDRK